MNVIPSSWLPKVRMKRFHGHWTAGGRKANSSDRKAYHFLWEDDGQIVRGVDVAKNSGGTHDGYAAHTLNANTDAIGGSLCGMMGAVESPFYAGSAPITEIQWTHFIDDAARIVDFYGIPVGLKTTLFHSEVQANLGITQRGKWDINRLPFDPTVVGARAIGDRFREQLREALKGNLPLVSEPAEPIPAGGVARVTVDGLNFRRGPGAQHESTGSLPAGTMVEIVGVEGDWAQVKTPGGYTGWVHRNYIKMVDGPAPLEPTTPSPVRVLVNEIRDKLDKIESLL